MGISRKTALRVLLNSGLWTLCVSWPQPGTPQVARNDQSHPTHLVVKYADLDLASHSGIVELYLRIERAARAVCTPKLANAGKPTGADACFVDAVGRAVAEINQPALTRYFVTAMAQERPVDSHEPP